MNHANRDEVMESSYVDWKSMMERQTNLMEKQLKYLRRIKLATDLWLALTILALLPIGVVVLFVLAGMAKIW